MASNLQSSLANARAQLARFITALGYTEDDRIYFRLLAPKNFDPDLHPAQTGCYYTNKEGKRIRISQNVMLRNGRAHVYYGQQIRTYDDGVKYLFDMNQVGLAVYMTINPGGNKKGEIEGSRVIFFEDDNRNKAVQLRLAKWLSEDKFDGVFAVETNKSVHTYLIHDEFLDVTDAMLYQLRAIRTFKSDAAIFDAARIMRVPGFDHTSVNNLGEIVRFPVNIVHEWDGKKASLFHIDDYLKPATDADIMQAIGETTVLEARPISDDPMDPRNWIQRLPKLRDKGNGWYSAALPAPGVSSDDGVQVEWATGKIVIRSGSNPGWERQLRACSEYLGMPELTAFNLRKWLGIEDQKTEKELRNERKEAAVKPMGDAPANGIVPTAKLSEGDQKWVEQRSYWASHTIDQQYFSYDNAWFGKYKMIAVKSAMGTGKTYSIGTLLGPEGPLFSTGALLLNARNASTIQTIGELNKRLAPYDRKFRHFQANKQIGHEAIAQADGLVSMVIDSIFTIKPENCYGKVIFIDEANATLRQLLLSSTLNGKRQVVIEKLRMILRHAAAIILLDGNLTNHTLDTFAAMAQTGDVVIDAITVQNTFQPAKMNVTLREVRNEKDELMVRHQHSDMFNCVVERYQQIKASSKHRVIPIVTDNQSLADAWKENFTVGLGAKVLLIDRNTIADPAIKNIAANLPTWLKGAGDWTDPEGHIYPYNENDALIKGSEIDIVIMSPTCAQGYDLSGLADVVDHTGYAMFEGIIPIDDCLQFPRRWRECLNWKIDCAPYSTYKEADIDVKWNESRKAKIQEMLAEAAQCFKLGKNDEVFTGMFTRLGADNEVNMAWDQLHSIKEFERKYTFKCLHKAMEIAGWNVKVETVSKFKSVEESIKEAKANLKRAKTEAIFNAADITDAEAEAMEGTEISPEDALALEKHYITSRLAGITESKLWTVDLLHKLRTDRDYLRNLENFVLLLHPERYERNLTVKMNSAEAKARFAQDIRVKRDLTLIRLDELNILQFARNGVITDEDPAYQKLINRCQRSKSMQLVFGTVTKAGARRFFNKLCTMAGIKIVSEKHCKGMVYSYYSPLKSEQEAELIERINNAQYVKFKNQAETLDELESQETKFCVAPIRINSLFGTSKEEMTLEQKLALRMVTSPSTQLDNQPATRENTDKPASTEGAKSSKRQSTGAAVLEKVVAKAEAAPRDWTLTYEPMPGVEIAGFSIGDKVECKFPDNYTNAEKREAQNDYPWGERGEILGFRQQDGVGGRLWVDAIVKFDSGVSRLIDEEMMVVVQ